METHEPFAAPETEALDVIAGLVPEFDDEWELGGSQFYDRLCVALCRLASMRSRRPAALRRAPAAGGPGRQPRARRRGSCRRSTAPSTRRRSRSGALAEDRVVEVSDGLDERGAGALRGFAELTTLTLHPSRRRRALARGDLRRPRRRAVRVHVTERAPDDVDARQDGRARRQRPNRAPTAGTGAAALRRASTWPASSTSGSCSGSSASRWRSAPAAGLSDEAAAAARRRCRPRSGTSATRCRGRSPRPPRTPAPTLARRAGALLGRTDQRAAARGAVGPGVEVPPELEPIAQSVLAEALRNARKHAQPSRVCGRGRHRRDDLRARGAQRRRRLRRTRRHRDGPAAGRAGGAPARRAWSSSGPGGGRLARAAGGAARDGRWR